MAYRIAGIDVHKRMLAVVIADVEAVGEFTFERRQFGSAPAQLRLLAEWLVAQQAEEVVMESTAQYWRPVWATLEREWKPMAQQRDGAAPRGGTLHLAQAQSNRGRPGRKPLADKAYYEKVLNAPHTIKPDQLEKSGKKAKIEGVDGKRVITDGTHPIELYVMKMSHDVAMLFPYLPKEKLLVQAGA